MQKQASYKDSESFPMLILWRESEFGNGNHCFYRSYANKLIQKATNVLVCPHEKSGKAEKSFWILLFIKRDYRVETHWFVGDLGKCCPRTWGHNAYLNWKHYIQPHVTKMDNFFIRYLLPLPNQSLEHEKSKISASPKLGGVYAIHI